MKSQTKSSSSQIRNLINSSLKSNSIRRSVGIGQFDEKSSENLDILVKPSKKTVTLSDEVFVEENNSKKELMVLEKKDTFEEEYPTDRNDKDNFVNEILERTDADDYLNNFFPMRRVTCDVPKKKTDEGLIHNKKNLLFD